MSLFVSDYDLEAYKVAPHSNMQTSAAVAAFDRAGTILAEYMTPEELAGELGVCKRTLDRWHASRSGPPRVTVGRRPLYRRDAVAQWLRKREEDLSNGAGRRARRRGA
jgi:CO/xanthine dehydrogenase Mo-binding subunit